MARLLICVLALAACGLASPVPFTAQQQVQLMSLYDDVRVFEPSKFEHVDFNFDQSLNMFTNATAVNMYKKLIKFGLLPRDMIFASLNDRHLFEAQTLYYVLYSAKDFETFVKAAKYVKSIANPDLFIYVLNIVVLRRPDTYGFVIPSIHDVSPTFFHSGEVMDKANYLRTVFKDHEGDFVIMWNETRKYSFEELAYFTHDPEWITLYYNLMLAHPYWLPEEPKRGDIMYMNHKQILTRYYLERLSNGMGEIPDLNLQLVKTGYEPGLAYYNGVPFPDRPNDFDISEFDEVVTEIFEYERRVRDAIQSGYFFNSDGKMVEIRKPEARDLVGRMIESGANSPNPTYYGNFIRLWQLLLGNSYFRESFKYYKKDFPMVIPSAVENYQTALRDPAYYMLWKRVLGFFNLWKELLPKYTHEELSCPSVVVEKFEVDKLVTFFEYSFLNITQGLYPVDNHKAVLLQRPQLNHKPYTTRLTVKSDSAKKVFVRYFLGPKYDSRGVEIPIEKNWENFFQIDQFIYDLPAGETVITRNSEENVYFNHRLASGHEIYTKAANAAAGNGQFDTKQFPRAYGFPYKLVLPKGRTGGMPFVFFAIVSDYVPYDSQYRSLPQIVYMTGQPLGYPFDRPLYYWQLEGLQNYIMQDVQIFHKPAPEVFVAPE